MVADAMALCPDEACRIAVAVSQSGSELNETDYEIVRSEARARRGEDLPTWQELNEALAKRRSRPRVTGSSPA